MTEDSFTKEKETYLVALFFLWRESTSLRGLLRGLGICLLNKGKVHFFEWLNSIDIRCTFDLYQTFTSNSLSSIEKTLRMGKFYWKPICQFSRDLTCISYSRHTCIVHPWRLNNSQMSGFICKMSKQNCMLHVKLGGLQTEFCKHLGCEDLLHSLLPSLPPNYKR